MGQILGKGQEVNQVERQMLGIHRIHSDYLLSYFSLSEKVDSVYKKPDFQSRDTSSIYYVWESQEIIRQWFPHSVKLHLYIFS